MGDAAFVETAQHVADGVDLADLAQELVAKPLALGRPFDQPGDIDEFELRRHHPLRLDDIADGVQAAVGDGDPADVGLDGGKRKISGLRRLGLG